LLAEEAHEVLFVKDRIKAVEILEEFCIEI
jgi:hypothetical protein